MNPRETKIGFVGVGRMGANMARRLRDLDYAVTAVFDARPEAADGLAKEIGAETPDDLAGVTARADVIFTVVTDDRAMLGLFSESGDSLLREAQGKVFINCATVTPSVHVEVEKRATAAGAETIEACMASSITQAREGSLFLMCGGRLETFERMEPLLRDLSADLRHVGETGRAAQVKALVNMVMNINTAGLAEGLALGDALGLDLNRLREIFALTGAASRVLETDGEDMQQRDHACFFSAAHAAKDSGIALALGEAEGLRLPLAKATKEQYDRMVAAGLGDLDKSGVAEMTFRDRGNSGPSKT